MVRAQRQETGLRPREREDPSKSQELPGLTGAQITQRDRR